VWCAAHAIGITETQKEQTDQARANLAGVKNININGQGMQDFLKTATNQQVLIAQRAVVDFLSADAMSHLLDRGHGHLRYFSGPRVEGSRDSRGG
jgi:hypothetical protein